MTILLASKLVNMGSLYMNYTLIIKFDRALAVAGQFKKLRQYKGQWQCMTKSSVTVRRVDPESSSNRYCHPGQANITFINLVCRSDVSIIAHMHWYVVKLCYKNITNQENTLGHCP